jgi:hypothetical protein
MAEAVVWLQSEAVAKTISSHLPTGLQLIPEERGYTLIDASPNPDASQLVARFRLLCDQLGVASDQYELEQSYGDDYDF